MVFPQGRGQQCTGSCSLQTSFVKWEAKAVLKMSMMLSSYLRARLHQPHVTKACACLLLASIYSHFTTVSSLPPLEITSFEHCLSLHFQGVFWNHKQQRGWKIINILIVSTGYALVEGEIIHQEQHNILDQQQNRKWENVRKQCLAHSK